MKLKIPGKPIDVTVSLMPGACAPSCIDPKYRPFNEMNFRAIAVAFWCDDEENIEYVSIRAYGNPYIVRYNDLSTLSILAIKKEAKVLPVETSVSVIQERYAIDALVLDLLMINNRFNIQILGLTKEEGTLYDAVHFKADFD